jgi:hypothetical protein
VTVLKVEGTQVRLNAGEAHGLTRDAELSVFPSTADFSNPANRIAQVKVTTVEAVEAWAQIIDPQPAAPIEQGAQAVLQSMTNTSFTRNIALDISDAALHDQFATALQAKGKGFARLAGASEPVHFVVNLLPDGELRIEDAADQPVPNLRPAIRATDPNAVDKVVGRLVHLARYQGVRDLSVADTNAAQKLKVELIGSTVNRPGDKVGLRITNLQPAGDANTLNIAVLALSSDWSIAQIYPAGAANFQSVSPAETIDLEFEAYLPDGQTLSVDTMKVFATRSTTNFRWLELAALDQPPMSRSITRSIQMDPLEQLLAAVTDETSTTRAVRLVGSSGDKAWTVEQREIRVEA